MRLPHILMALGVAVIWGINFIFIKFALVDFPPILLTALRFTLSAVPFLFLPRPKLAFREMAVIALFLFVAQYALLFSGMRSGMPPGLASMLLQTQVFFSILLAIPFLGEKPTLRQGIGMAVALGGIALMATTVGGDVTWRGLSLTLASALTFGLGNILLRRSGGGGVPILALVAWLSLIPPLPLFALSWETEGGTAILHALTTAHPLAIVSLLYIAAISTLAGFGLWGTLLKHYPTATVTPFALLVPVVGIVISFLVTGETFSQARLIGTMLVMGGLCLVVLRVPAFVKASRV
ncbi:MAG TPA: EamA family transporter [Dongiaceae bacterium]|nr:EamA family transporter [Dongiaceae bacterium]